ncbi:MAG TPA: AlkA N-terminal domain-containing protein [Microbacteriaceae bacterium]|nr:AlkA N-terminal domain-containing protein [Microbacteriaceae bacterium]
MLQELTLEVSEPFDARGTFERMAAHAIPGMEVGNDTSYSRTIGLPGGPAWFELSLAPDLKPSQKRNRRPSRRPSSELNKALSKTRDPEPTEHAESHSYEHLYPQLLLRAELTDVADLGELALHVRRLFDLDADARAIDQALSQHKELTPLVAATPGIRVPGAIDPHEMLIRTIVGQQISVAAARTALTHLVHTLGQPINTEDGRANILFPTMQVIAERGQEALRGPAQRIRAIIGAARTLAEGSLTLGFNDDPEDQRATLLAMPGIGPWTADYVRMRVLSDSNIFLPGDSAVRAGAKRIGLPSDAKLLNEWASRTSPWQSYLTAHLWRANKTAG